MMAIGTPWRFSHASHKGTAELKSSLMGRGFGPIVIASLLAFVFVVVVARLLAFVFVVDGR